MITSNRPMRIDNSIFDVVFASDIGTEPCNDATSTLNPGLCCPQPKGHDGPCGNGRQMWWSDILHPYYQIKSVTLKNSK